MPSLIDLFERAALDPLVRASLLAAGVLLIAAIAGGLARRDALALRRPATWLAVAAALLASLVLAATGDRLAAGAFGGDALALSSRGWERVPLYLLALGYGPSVGLLATVATAFVQAGPWGFGAGEATLVLEVVVVGWLGLGPSPRRARWAGPLAVVAGWLLATATMGLSAWAADGRPIAVEPFLRGHASPIGAVALAALLAAAVPPTWWRRHVPGASDRVRMERDDERVRWLRPLVRPASRSSRRRARWRPAATTIVPTALRRRRRPVRRLAPVVQPASLERSTVPERLAPERAAPNRGDDRSTPTAGEDVSRP